MTPTVLMMMGWRLYFFSEEGNEPPHIHARKGDAECKFWLRVELYGIEEEWSHNLTPRLRREIRQIILTHFDMILNAWNEYMERRDENK